MTFNFPKRKINIFCGPDDPAAGAPAAGAPAAAPAAAVPAAAPANGPKTYTQDEINAMIARDRRGLQEQVTKTTKQLEEIRDSANTTAQQRDALQGQIDELQAQFQTKEQQATEQYKKLEKKYQTETAQEKENVNRWRSRFENQLMYTDISRHAAAADAFDVDQISAILVPKTKVVERMDEGGKPTGEFTSQVDFTVKGADGKPVAMKLSIEDAIKAMKDWPEKYGNLFKAKANGGLGGDTSQSGQPAGPLKEITSETSMEEYIKQRKALGLEEVAR